MKSLVFLLLTVLACPIGFADTHSHSEAGVHSAKCDCPPDCHCKKPGGTCPANGPCVEGCKCDAMKAEPPTYQADPTQVGKYETGYVKPLTFEQHKAKAELDALAASGELTYDYDVSQIGKYATGYVKPLTVKSAKTLYHHMQAAEAAHKQIDFRDILKNQTPGVLNQGSCGSCVVFSFTANAQWSMSLRGFADLPILSPQHLMNCGGPAGQCSGDYGERVAQRLVTLGSLVAEKEYPYTARTSKCKDTDGMERYGQFQEWKTISGSFQSIVEALNARQPVSVGVAADGRFSSYRSGVYNGFGSMGTNHYVLAVGASCGSSVDSDGNCQFNAKGQLVNGNHEAIIHILNSWGETWGDNGYIAMQFENKQGRRNNNIAGGDGNAQVIDTGLPWTPPEPVTFPMSSVQMDLLITVNPKSVMSVESVKVSVKKALDAIDKAVGL